MGQKEKNDNNNLIKGFIFFVVLDIVLIGVCSFLFWHAVETCSIQAKETYQATFAEVSEETAQGYYNKAFEIAEKEYHVNNRVSISIDDIKEQSKLEVLQVREVEFIVHDKQEGNGNLPAWISIPGNGVFTVDMTLSEFLIDNERHYVIARIPTPQLTNCKVDNQTIEVFDLETGKLKLFNGNFAEGTTVAENDIKEGWNRINEKLLSNQQYLSKAKESAERLLMNLITNLNPEIEDLKVEIEFVD